MDILFGKIILFFRSWFFSGVERSNREIRLQIFLTNIISIIGFICLFMYSLIFKEISTKLFSYITLAVSFFYFAVPIINRFEIVNLTRYFLIFLGNSIILFISLFISETSNFHIFFVLQVVVIFLIFKYNEIKKIIFSLFITFCAIGIYEVDYYTDKEYFFEIILSEKDNYVINNILFITLIITITIFIICFIAYIQKSEESLLKMNEELKEKTSNLIQVEKFSALGELTAGISHELNQPLNVINIISQAILKDIEKQRFITDNIKNDMCEINVQVQRMSEIIGHMKIFTRSSVGYPKERLNINLIIDGVLNFFREQFKDNKIEIYVELSREISYILGDSLRLEHLFINLITNARDAVEKSNKGIKIIKIKTEEVKREGETFILFQIYDNGNGIDGKFIDKIFQPFFTTKDPGKGTGLGLAIVNKIIEDHRGHIEFQSKEGLGTTFNLYFPVENIVI